MYTIAADTPAAVTADSAGTLPVPSDMKFYVSG